MSNLFRRSLSLYLVEFIFIVFYMYSIIYEIAIWSMTFYCFGSEWYDSLDHSECFNCTTHTGISDFLHRPLILICYFSLRPWMITEIKKNKTGDETIVPFFFYKLWQKKVVLYFNVLWCAAGVTWLPCVLVHCTFALRNRWTVNLGHIWGVG